MIRIQILLAFLVSYFLLASNSYARYNPSWNWKVYKTDSFLIYYPEGHEAFAQRVLSLSPEVKSDIDGYFGKKSRRLPIVLNPGTDLFNGFYSPFPNRISLFETPLYTLNGFGSPTSDIMDLVFTHEYTHYAHITERVGWNRLFGDVFGESAGILNFTSPLWMIEGITTNTETMFTDGGRGRSPEFKGQTYSFTENGKFWSLSQAGASSPYAPPGGRFYMSGLFMVDYLNRTYGADSFSKISEYQARHLFRGAGSALKNVTKKSSRKFYRDFLEDFNAQADSVKRSHENQGIAVGKTVLSEPIDNFGTYFWSNENHIIAFRSGYGKKNAFIEFDPVTGTAEETKTGSVYMIGKMRPFKDGKVIFSEPLMHPLGDTELNVTDLVSLDIDSGKRTRLTKNAHVFSCGVAPDNSKIALVVRNGMWMDLLVMNSDGSGMRRLVSKPGLYWEAPSWSPDGSVIAVSVKSGGKNGIAFVNPENGEIDMPFEMSADGYNYPSFSPDGEWLVFSSSVEGVWDIYAWNIGDKKLYRLTSVSWEASNPQVSPDGKTLAFLNTVRGVKEIRLTPFEPGSGKEIQIKSGGVLINPDVDEGWVSVKPSGIPLSAWNPYLRFPYMGVDDRGSQYGLGFMGGDPLGINTYSAAAFYGVDSERFGYDFGLTNRSFWPSLRLRAYDSSLEGNTLGGEDSRWFRERGGEISVSLDQVLHRIVPSAIVGSYYTGVRIRKFDGLGNLHVNKDHDLSRALFGGFSILRMPSVPARDLIPGWGQALDVSYERGYRALGSELDTHNLFTRVTQFVPSPFHHHGFEISVVHQNQSGLLHYSTTGSIPRGYHSDESPGGFNLNKTLKASAEYYFPLSFPDKGLGMTLLHLNLVYGSLFVDHGAGWNDSFTNDKWANNVRTTVGGSLRSDLTMFYFIPVDIGIQAGYKTVEEDWFVGLVIGDYLSGTGFIGKKIKNGDGVAKFSSFKKNFSKKLGFWY